MEAIPEVRRLSSVKLTIVDPDLIIKVTVEAIVLLVSTQTIRVRVKQETLPEGIKADIVTLSRKTGYQHGGFTKNPKKANWNSMGYVWRFAGLVTHDA